MSPKFKKKDYKNYVEDYGSNKSNSKLVYILIGLTALTVALVVLLVLFLNGTFGGGGTTSTPKPEGTEQVSTTDPEGTQAPTTAPGTNPAGETVNLTIDVDAEQVPEGDAPAYTKGSGDQAGSILIDNALKNKGDLIVANAEYPLDGTYTPMKNVNIYDESILVMKMPVNVSKTDLMMERRALSALAYMLKGAKETDGHEKYFVDKSYAADATDMDYLTGLSFDLGFTRLEGQTGKFTELPQGQWLINNAYKYGIIQRYTADKTAVTGMGGDSTHYRYVGFPHSYIIKSQNLALEEYVKYVREKKHIYVNKNDRLAYEVMYEYADPDAADGKTVCKLSPAANEALENGTAKITVSGDNFGGFIITVIYQ